VHPALPFVTRRSTALALVVAAHCIVPVVLSLKRLARSPAETERPLVWTFIRPRTTAQTPAEARHAAHSSEPPISSHARTPTSEGQAPAIGSAPHVDWAEQARNAAIDQTARSDEARRRADALPPPRSPLLSNRVPGPKFHWYQAGTNRVEALTGGGLAVNLTDQCVLVFAGLIVIPACALEKTPARSDLFDHLRDAPPLGDWGTDSPEARKSLIGVIPVFELPRGMRACRMRGPPGAGWSSLAARRAHNPKVAGSNPAPATK
jgi:hypothetical protein